MKVIGKNSFVCLQYFCVLTAACSPVIFIKPRSLSKSSQFCSLINKLKYTFMVVRST